MEKKKKIEEMYFIQKKNLTQIAQELQLSVSYISRILKLNKTYQAEKEQRKKNNEIKRRKQQKTIIYSNRKHKINIDYQLIKKMHEEDVKELSKRAKLNDNALRKWCSLYKYNQVKNIYEFDTTNVLKPVDFPMYIKA